MRKEREQLINLVKLQAKEMEVRVCAADLVPFKLLPAALQRFRGLTP